MTHEQQLQGRTQGDSMNPDAVTDFMTRFDEREKLRMQMDIMRALICDLLLDDPEQKTRIDMYVEELRRLRRELREVES